MDIYRYKLEYDNKIKLDVFKDAKLDKMEKEYYDELAPLNEDLICMDYNLDSNCPTNINHVYAQFYSSPQHLEDVKNRFIEDVSVDIEREKYRYENILIALSNKLVKMQEIEI